ncbi:MAG: cytochrome C oxidase subunit IV family protein [Gemmatimonadota bacterium]
MDAHATAGEHEHPTAATYAKIAVTLVILTALEVAVYYVESIRRYLVPILLILMVIKFALVAMYYMHLKQDSKLFSGLFVFPIIIAIVVILALIALFSVAHPTLTTVAP